MVVTPFTGSGSVSEAELPKIVAFVLENGCHGVSSLGLAAEVDTLSMEERRRIAAIVVESAAGMPALVGCGAHDTDDSISLAGHAAEIGAAVVVVATPRRPEWSRAQLLEHFLRIAAEIQPLPVMVQDAPSFLGVSLDREFLRELHETASNVVYAKSESVPAADKIAELVELGTVCVFGGHGALYYLDALDAGAGGMIPGCEMPSAYARIFELHQMGEREEARRIFTQTLPLVVTQFQSLEYFIAATKTVLAQLGVIQRADVRNGARISQLGRRLLLDHASAAGALPAVGSSDGPWQVNQSEGAR